MSALDSLPPTILSAEKLSGSIVSIGNGYIPAIDMERCALRLSTLLREPQEYVALSSIGAAWFWGAVRHAPLVPEFSVHVGHRVVVRSRGLHTRRELRLQESDVEYFNGYGVTSPTRTVADLLQGAPSLSNELRQVCRTLFLHEGCSRSSVHHRLSESKRFTNSARIRRWLREL